MNAPALVDFLKTRVALCQHLSDERIAAIVAGSRVASYEANEALIYRGADASYLGVILAGEVTVSVAAESGGRQELAVLQAGGMFGEMALMTGDKTMADVIAKTPCQLLRIPVPVFQSVIMGDQRAVQHISKVIVERYQEVMADPAKATAAFYKSKDPYGLRLKSERAEKILIINSGSSSLKYSFFDSENEKNVAHGVIERIGSEGTSILQRGPNGEVKQDLSKGGYAEAFAAMIAALCAPATGVIREHSEISVVGHRVVHGGERFAEAVVVDDAVLAEIEALNPLAPLHNPVNVAGLREARRLFSSVPHVAVFDTAFHQTLPSFAYLYGLPYEYYERKAVRRYGFHGSSHSYVALAAAQYLERRHYELALVSCHLGNGASVCAVDHGRSVDTSMGFTPGEGLIMGSRCGDIDAGVLAYLEREEGLSGAQIDEMLNRRSGLLGLSGLSADMREIERAAETGDRRALLALKAFGYRVRKYIGAYVAAMGGLDVLVFTGGIGQGSAGVRSLALQGLRCMGIELDEQRNRDARGFTEICRISTSASRVAVLVVPTDEEKMIARETLRALSRSYIKRVLDAQLHQPFPIEISAHHIHLAQAHVEALYGPGHTLTRQSDLSQPGQFACQEQVTVIGPKGRIERVRVLGPARKATQLEIAMTEQFKLGIHPPVRESGDIQGTPGCILEGPAGRVAIEQGVICALRHIHMTPADALRYGVKDKSTVRVRVPGNRELVFGDVRIRVDPNYRLAMHIDTDEGNAAGLETGAQGTIDSIQREE